MAKEAKIDANETILEKAERIVMGNREERYGPPKENHTCTAELWNAYLKRRRHVAEDVMAYQLTPEDICMPNILQKVSRCAHTITKDNLADMAGWARCVERILDEDNTADDVILSPV